MDDGTGTILHIDDITLRPWRDSDAPLVLAACQDVEIGRWVAIPQPFLAGDAEVFIAEATTMWRDGTGAAFAVVDAATDHLLGAVTRFGPDGHLATFGCWVAPDGHVDAGSVDGHCEQLADWTFTTTPTMRIDGYIMVGNDASERMVQRLGWQREGVLRAWHLRPDGSTMDCVVYSLIRDDAVGG